MSETENFNSTSWNGWKDIPAGHGQAVSAVFALREHTDRYRAELVAARNEWETAKTSSQQIYDSDTASARKQCEDERTRFTNECSSDVQTTENRRNVTNTVMNACNNFVSNLPKNGAEKAISAAKGTIPSVESYQKDVARAISEKVKAYQTLRDCQIAEAERVRNDKLDKARTEQIDRDTQAEHRFDAKGKTIREKGQADICSGFNKATVKAYQQEINTDIVVLNGSGDFIISEQTPTSFFIL